MATIKTATLLRLLQGGFARTVGLIAAFGMAGLATAASPSSGSLGPTVGAKLNWVGTAIGTGGLDDETLPIEGVNVDTFTLTVTGSHADWANKAIKIKVNWSNILNDYDLYVRKETDHGELVSLSGAGAPHVSEQGAIDVTRFGVTTYLVRVVYFGNTPLVDQPVCSAEVVQSGTPIYQKDGIKFSANTPCKAPFAFSDGEPSSRCDYLGNYYTAGIRGVPAGCDLWYFDLRPESPTFDPFMRNPIYRGQPDGFSDNEVFPAGGDGGGDVDLAVGFKPGPLGVPSLAFTSLVAANIFTAVSHDLGQTWLKNPLGNVTGGIPVDDRQWFEFLDGNVVYMLYRTLQPAVTQIQRSNDGGFTWGPARTAGMIGQVGSIDVDQNDGTVYVCGTSGRIAVGRPETPKAEPLIYEVVQAAADSPGVNHIFPVIRVGDDGTVYFCYSNGADIKICYSLDKGRTWSVPYRVNDGPETRTALFPWLETGPSGKVIVAWYGTPNPANDDNADWRVFFAQIDGAHTSLPVIRQAVASDHVIHAMNISTGGTLGNANRNLLDYFQIVFDPQGAAVISYTDDHNDFNGNVFVTRQISGMGINGKKLKKQTEGSALPAKQPLSNDGSQVVDFARDVSIGVVAGAPVEDALDILSIKYGAEPAGLTDFYVKATTKVSDLQSLTGSSLWRVNFTANAPDATLNATGLYSNGISDRGDQFYLRADYNADGTWTWSWGTVVRNFNGSLTYTRRGNALGSVDMVNKTITVKVLASQLNAFAAKGPIVRGSVLCGLRGFAFGPGSSAAKSDRTYGGTQVTLDY